ncbi:unnamed protein product [Schistocephalus solidus]|uniref:SH3 domain-containing protein n=1 Tax=Schistocephalus solidus TaxID=70667 RepID=A0A183SGF2_SCHSO|nr:unnamed protein product [Schistocephalus solidus]
MMMATHFMPIKPEDPKINVLKAQLESDYSKGLSRLHSRLSKAAEALSGTVASAWQQTVSSLETEALVHRTISEQLQSQLLPSSKEFSAGLDRQLKPACSEVDAASSRLLSCRRVEWKLRKKAFAAYRLACNSLTTQASCGSRLEARVARAGTMLPPGVGGVGMGGGITPKLAPARPGSGHGAGSELQSETSRTRVVEKSVTLPLPSACPPRDGDQSSSLDSAVILTQTSQCLANQSSLPEKNSFKLYELERGRLEHLCDTLTSYRTTVFDNLRCLNAADRTIQEAVDKVDKAADFAKFCSSLCNRSTKASRPTVTRPISVDLSGSGAVGDWAKMKSLARHSQSPEPKSDEQQPVVGGSKQSLIFLPGEVDSCFNTPPELQSLWRGSAGLRDTRKANAEELNYRALLLLANEIGDEGTVGGGFEESLTNLVEVYSSTPTFADESTLAEARRRLFISRCRLAYVTACRARLACLLAPDDSSHSTSLSSLRKRLSGAGFANSKDLPVRLLAVPTKDQTEVQRYASLPLTRWLDVRTPVEVPIKILEWPPVSSDLWKMECLPDNELHLLNLTAILSYPDTNWVMAATASRTNALQDLQATDTLADLTDSDFESDLEEDQQPGVVPNFVLPNGHPVAQLKLDIQTVPQSAPPQLSASPQTVNSDNASPECPSAPAPVEKSRKLRFIRKFKCGQSMRRRPLSPDKRTSPPPPIRTTQEYKFLRAKYTRCTSALEKIHHLPRFTVILLFFPFIPVFLPKNLFGRLGGLSRHVGRANKRTRRPEIITPWREDASSASATGAASAPVEGKSGGAQGNRDTVRSAAGSGGPPSYWPSLVSLHCIGWAKVLRDFTPTCDSDLPLLEGEIVSIIQKSSADWWIGEAGGKRGRFPVSFIEEF